MENSGMNSAPPVVTHSDIKATTPWYRKDKYGYPIETYTNRSKLSNFIRIVYQNIRKITG